jgi:hypothetical protein
MMMKKSGPTNRAIRDDVPAWVCEQCGEPMFGEATVDAIQEMLQEMDNRQEKLMMLAA